MVCVSASAGLRYTSRSVTKPLPFQGTSRFQVRRCLGAGGFGTVHEAFDRKRNALVALKVLSQASPDDLYRFKQEYRSLSGITHRNLVTLYELFTEEDQWFFSMELVQGTDFISHHRSADAKASIKAPLTADDSLSSFEATLASTAGEGRQAQMGSSDGAVMLPKGDLSAASYSQPSISAEQLVRSLQQLAQGLLFLHDQGFVHRDIKPANVLCTPTGRVVLLDFGLAQEITSGFGLREPSAAGIAGTPDYMAPEQALAQPATAAADWYSVGVLLYEAIAGRVPFSGTVSQVLRQKVSQDPPPPPPIERGDVSAELHTLCMQLLHRRPELRPSGKAVLASLRELAAKLDFKSGSARTAEADRTLRDGYPRGEALFIGRQRQMQALADAFAASRHKTVVTLCRGESGAGKSALCKQFLKELVAREPALVVLSGRCYAYEEVPFKALDGVVDSLSRLLRHRPREELAALLPRDIPAAARLFPVLMQVAAIKEAPPRRIADDLQVKQVASSALRELVLRLSAQRPTVLYIDDLQWGDRDGISLLLDLLRPPDSPRLLLIVAYRSDEEKSSAALERLRDGLAGEIERSVALTEVSLDGLSAQEADALARLLLPEAAQERAAAIATESGGNPLFVAELSRAYWGEPSTSPPGGSLPISQSTLDGLIRARVERLPLAPQQLLSVIAVAGQPISRAAAALAAYADAEGTDEPQALALLRAERLIRVRYTQSGADAAAPREELLIYHDRIREAVVAGLLSVEVSTQHLRLAQALRASGHGDPEQMVFHLQHGGDLSGAAHYAVQASAQAYNALAYHQAVRLCRAALSTGKLAPADEPLIKARLADALVGAGHPKEAAETYLELAERGPTELAFSRRRQAAKQFFISGYVKEGYKVIEELLPAARLRIPRSSFGRMASLIFYQMLVAAHGMEFRERSESTVPAADLLRIDTCEAIASTTAVEPLLAANFATQFLWYALRAGEPRRIVVALTGAAGLLFAFGASPARTEQILARAQGLAERLQYAYGIGRCISMAGHIAYLKGMWREALAWLGRANEILKGDCVDARALVDYSGTVEILCLRGMGAFQPLAEKVQPYLNDAIERGRKSHELTVRLSAGFLLLLRDDEPDRAEAFVKAARQRLGQDVSLTYLFGIEAQLLVLVYRGRAEEAWRHFWENQKKVERSGLLRMDLFLTMWRSLCALLLLTSFQPLHLAEVVVEQLLGCRCVFARPLAVLYRAVVRRRQGRLAESHWLIREAEAGLASCDMSLHAACVRFRRGQWLGGAEGEELVRTAREWMASQRIGNPERMAAMMVPP